MRGRHYTPEEEEGVSDEEEDEWYFLSKKKANGFVRKLVEDEEYGDQYEVDTNAEGFAEFETEM